MRKTNSVKALIQKRTGHPGKAARRITCKFPSLKLARTVRVTSLLARDLLYLLEFDSQVISYTENAPWIAYPCDSSNTEYAFDFLLECPDRKQLVKLLRIGEQPPFQPRLRAACQKEGYELVIFTESIIRSQPRLNNIKLLTRYARLPVAPHHHRACTRFFAHNSSATLGSIIKFFEDEGLEQQSVLAMLYHRALNFDLMIPLTLQSAISLPRKDIYIREVA
ncbi:MAG: hypothetical protein QOH63_2168 [Acidobacteriota bacterium]|jgi:hypothetical protein|nr:hypothetical protein [Acidobacteriota bacterium]